LIEKGDEMGWGGFSFYRSQEDLISIDRLEIVKMSTSLDPFQPPSISLAGLR
jgi:hypothetical protein